MKIFRTLSSFCVLAALGLAVPLSVHALDDLVITEFMAENDSTFQDEDGDNEDWIEIYNAGTNTVNLSGWSLTDNPGNLTKWRFPNTNLAENAYLVVYASNKDRRIPGRALHTNFRIDASGEFLALVRPDGLSIASGFTPRYPLQAADISYGVATVPATSLLLSNGASARFTVPVNGNLGTEWTLPAFNDATWAPVTTGVGFENSSTAVIGDATVVADSLADWSESGVQGFNNWYYGFFLKTNAGTVYSAARFNAFPSGTGPHSLGNFWDGAVWRWFEGEPPFDMISRTTARPNIFPTATTNGLEHQVIRRWVSEIAGPASIEWRVAKKAPTGNGVTGRIYQNGTSRDSIALQGTNVGGIGRTNSLTLQIGDTIDFVLEPGADIVGDETFFNATIRGATTLAGLVRTDVGAMTTNLNASAYLRMPFTVSNATAIKALKLRIKYDDGFAAYLNGTPIVSRNAPDPLAWDSAATGSRADSDAAQSEEIDLTRLTDLVLNGANVLAIQGLNSSVTDGDFYLAAELEATTVVLNPSVRNYFLLPTPGSANGGGTLSLGPLASSIQHAPHDPSDADDIAVTARITPTFGTVTNVSLYYRVMFNSEVSVPMFDDGLHSDILPGDGIYGAVIPANVSRFGEMVRYYIVARDSQGSTTRDPLFADPLQSSQYYGAVVQNPELTNNLPVLHLFITPANLTTANNNASTRAPASIYYLGEFYDNIGMNRHGQSSGGFPKKSYDIDFNSDHHFRYQAGASRVDDINLLTTYPDKSHMRNILAYEHTIKPAGSPYHFVVPVRVQTNGSFFGDWHIVENGDADFLERIGRDPRGALYKVYNTFSTLTHTTIGGDPNSEKKTRKEEGNADLVALMNGLVLETSLSNRVRYMYDNVNVAEVLNNFAARSVTSDWDCCHKNYYIYRDTEGTGEWEAFPWDIDLSFGRNWDGTLSYWDPKVYPGNRIWGNWDNNGFFQVVLNMPLGRGIDATRQMYLRRVRSIVDELMQTNGTPANLLYYENIIDQLVPKLAPDAALDLAKWGTWGDNVGPNAGPIPTNSIYYHTLAQSVSEMKTNYLPRRRAYIFDQATRFGVGAEWPDPQPTNVVIRIGTIEYNPASGNQKDEYIQLINTNNIAVDISGWKLSGAIEHTFQAGVVIPRGAGSTNTLYVVADKKAFRSRTVAPRGGQSLYIEGPYQGQLSARGETIVLSDKRGRIVSTNLYIGNPSAAQQGLRITEIMYHPSRPPAGSPFDQEEFEYLEIKNIGATPIDLTGVHFAAGIEFSFTGSAITTLAPGGFVLVVKNLVAFTSRYGSGLPIAGQYVGFLDNGGDNLRLDDAVGEKILDFSYNNAWYPITDGPGASLVIVNETAAWNTWSLMDSWRPSFHDQGSPAVNDPPSAPPVLAVVINEILTHTDFPIVDQIELYNPNSSPVNVGGWYLSDDYGFPRKFRIPDGRTIAAGGYLVFTEDDFNAAASPTAFSLSSSGDEVYLFAGDGTGITGYFHGYQFDGAANGVTFGRYINSQTNDHLVAQISNTIGGPNSGPRVGPIVISEINYRPVDLPGGVDNDVDEYIELANITGSPVPLFDPGNPANTWHMRGGVDLDFPTGVIIPANGFVILVNFNPAYGPDATAFRSRFNVPANVPLFGPVSGKLSNTGDELRLIRPDAPGLEGVPYIVVDTVEYANQRPWPAAADGIGPTLQRMVVSAYGNDATNWTAVGPSPGALWIAGGSPPVVTQQPTNVNGVATRSATFSVAVSGAAPIFYQWRFNGTNIYGANGSSYTRSNLDAAKDAGTYSCIVFNSAGSTESLGAQLSISFPPYFAAHPTDQKVFIKPDTSAAPTTNVTFTVTAVSPSQTPLRYQWKFNGVSIPNATSASYTVVDVKKSDYGQYVCITTDNIESTESRAATLYPMIRPLAGEVVALPLVQTNVLTGRIGLSVAYPTIFPPPFTNEWRRGSPTIGTTVSSNLTDVFSFAAGGTAAPAGSNGYRVVVKWVGNGQPGVQSTVASVFIVPDSDSDGIPDDIETALGLNPNDAGDANGDLDGDSMKNKDEYAAGTDPRSAASYLKVEQTTTPGSAIVRVAAIAGKTYTVRYSDQLGGAWQTLGHIPSQANDTVVQLPDPTWTSARFYRLLLPAQQ